MARPTPTQFGAGLRVDIQALTAADLWCCIVLDCDQASICVAIPRVLGLAQDCFSKKSGFYVRVSRVAACNGSVGARL
jgi:hypothetical protein